MLSDTPEKPVNGSNKAQTITAFDPQHYLGTVSQVGAASLEMAFGHDGNGGAKNLAQRAAVGDHVIVKVGHYGIIGKIVTIRMQESSLKPLAIGESAAPDLPPIASVQFTNTLDGTTGKIVPGIIAMPRIENPVYLADPSLVRAAAESQTETEGSMTLNMSFATLRDTERTPLKFTPEMVFSRHCALLGTTGSGKSWSLAKLIEEAGKLRSKVIVFDATGEYSPLKGNILHIHLGNHPNPPEHSREVVVPYFELTERDLFAIFKPKGQSQAPKLRAAIKSLKLAALVPDLALDGTIMKANRAKQDYQAAYKKYYDKVEDERAAFDIKHLARQIEHECVRPNRSAMEPQFWGDISAVDQTHCTSLINRIRDITQSVNLAPIFDPIGKPSLLKVIDAFIEDDESRILCISLQYLSFAHHAREIIANATGRHLMRMAQDSRFRENPAVIVVDEAHQFLNKRLTDPDGEYPLDAFALIAKEGRKYALSLCMATQRPRDIPEGVLSQMGSLVVHRLINDLDRSVIERASGEMNKECLDSLPALAPGEAVVLGVDFPMPLVVKVVAPDNPPNSLSANYQRFWR